MRFSKNLLFAAFTLFAVSSATASSDPSKTVTSEIRDLLQLTFADEQIDHELKVHITFMITEQNELLILSTSAKEYDSEIKSRLNYKALEATDLKKGHKYTLPIVIKK